ncbi:MAG: hypothetical protein RI953_1139, partial [Pseudomonadota bacterium]
MITSLIRKSFSGLFQLDTGVELTSQRSLAVVFLSFLVAQLSLIATRFNWIFIDADQLVIAEQARWISMGLFFEPYFYGQNYLFPIDAYLSSILVFLGVNPLSAVQFCTLFFFYAPLSAAIVLFRGDRFRLLV